MTNCVSRALATASRARRLVSATLEQRSCDRARSSVDSTISSE